MQLRDMVAVVTGSSRGLGRATALELARRGARVVVNYAHSQDLAEAVTRQIVADGGEALCVRADATKYEEVEGMVQRALDRWGRVDIMVNNAGILRDRTLR